MAFRAYDVGTGLRHEVGVRMNCDKNECNFHHAEHGNIVHIFDPITEDKTITHVLSGGSYTVNGHATDVVERTVRLPSWAEINSDEGEVEGGYFVQSQVLIDEMDADLNLYEESQARQAVEWVLQRYNLSPKGE